MGTVVQEVHGEEKGKRKTSEEEARQTAGTSDGVSILIGWLFDRLRLLDLGWIGVLQPVRLLHRSSDTRVGPQPRLRLRLRNTPRHRKREEFQRIPCDPRFSEKDGANKREGKRERAKLRGKKQIDALDLLFLLQTCDSQLIRLSTLACSTSVN